MISFTSGEQEAKHDAGAPALNPHPLALTFRAPPAPVPTLALMIPPAARQARLQPASTPAHADRIASTDADHPSTDTDPNRGKVGGIAGNAGEDRRIRGKGRRVIRPIASIRARSASYPPNRKPFGEWSAHSGKVGALSADRNHVADAKRNAFRALHERGKGGRGLVRGGVYTYGRRGADLLVNLVLL